MPTRYYSSVARPLLLKTEIDAATTTLAADHPADYEFVSGEPYIMALQRGTSNEELVLMKGGTATGGTATWTQCTRGYDGTTARSHPAGTKLEHVTAAIDFRQQQALADTELIHSAATPGFGAKPFLRRMVGGAQASTTWTTLATVNADERWVVSSIILSNMGPNRQTASLGIGLNGGDVINHIDIEPYSSVTLATSMVYDAGEVIAGAASSTDVRFTMSGSALPVSRFTASHLPQRYRFNHLLPSSGFVNWAVPANLVITQIVVAMIGAGHTGHFSLTVQDVAYYGKMTVRSGQPLLLNAPIQVYGTESLKYANESGPGNTNGYMAIAIYGHSLLS